MEPFNVLAIVIQIFKGANRLFRRIIGDNPGLVENLPGLVNIVPAGEQMSSSPSVSGACAQIFTVSIWGPV